MKLKCINDRIDHKKYALTIGNEYGIVALDVFFRSFNPMMVRLINDESLIGYFPMELFEFDEIKIPPKWVFQLNNKSISILPFEISKERYLCESSFWEEYYDSKPRAFLQLAKAMKRIGLEIPTYLITKQDNSKEE